MFNIAKSPI